MKRWFYIMLSVALAGTLLSGCGSKSAASGYDGPAGTLSEIAGKIYAKKPVELRLETRELDCSNLDLLKYNTGLLEASKIEEAVVSEPLITTQAYSMALVRVKEGENAKAVAEEMLNGIDQRKWICVEADNLKVMGCNQVIVLIMISGGLEETVTVDEIQEAFEAVCDGNQSFLLGK